MKYAIALVVFLHVGTLRADPPSSLDLDDVAKLSGTSHDVPIEDASAPLGSLYNTVVAGRFNNDPTLDMVFRRGSRTTLLVNPALFDCKQAATFDANDFAVLRGTGAQGRDELVVVSGSSIVAWSTTPSGFTIQRPLHTSTEAQLVLVADVDGDGDQDIVTVHHEATTIRIQFLHLSASGAVQLVTWHDAPIADEIEQIVAVDWIDDVNGFSEIAAMTAHSVHVFDLSGAWIQVAESPVQTCVAIAAVSPGGGGLQRLAWVTRPTVGVDRVRVIDPSGVVSATDAFGPVARVTPGQLDNQYADDLVLSFEDSHTFIVLYSDENDGYSDNNARKVEPSLEAVAGNTASVGLGDLDGDGDLDFGYPVQDEDLFHVHLNPANAEAHLKPVLTNVFFDSPSSVLRVLFAQPAGGSPVGSTHTEIAVWRMTSPTATGGTLDLVATHRRFGNESLLVDGVDLAGTASTATTSTSSPFVTSS